MMQNGCDDIYPAVLTNIYYGSTARRLVNNVASAFLWKIFGPPSPDSKGKQSVGVLLKNDI